MERKEIENLLDNYYAQKHSSAINVAYENQQKANKNKEYKTLHEKYRVLIREIGKAKAYGDTKKAKELEKELSNAKAELEKVMKKIEISPKDLVPQFICKLCNDTGKVDGNPCMCYKKRFYRLLAENYAEKKFATFEEFDKKLVATAKQKKQLEGIKDIFLKLAEVCPNNNNHIFLLCGTTGVGKTFLAECLVSKMLELGKIAAFVSAFDMNNNFLKYHTTFNDEKMYYYNLLSEPDLLVIDDLGTEPILKNVTLNYLTTLLDDRCFNKKTTIITTNLAPNQLIERYGDRVCSRILNKQDSIMLNIDGDDLRIKK